MKKLIFALGMLIIGLTNNSSQAQWVQKNGPYGAVITDFAVSGTNLFSATWGGGVFLSTKSGMSWLAVNSGIANTYVNKIMFYETIVAIGISGGHGIFTFQDNGKSWTHEEITTNRDVSSLVTIGTNVFAGLRWQGVFLNIEENTHWTAVNKGTVNYG